MEPPGAKQGGQDPVRLAVVRRDRQAALRQRQRQPLLVRAGQCRQPAKEEDAGVVLALWAGQGTRVARPVFSGDKKLFARGAQRVNPTDNPTRLAKRLQALQGLVASGGRYGQEQAAGSLRVEN